MKQKLLAIILLPMLLILGSCNQYKENEKELYEIRKTIYSLENLSENINNTLSESLDKKVIIVDQTGDTIVKYSPDSVTETTETRTVLLNFNKPMSDLQRSKYELQLRQERLKETAVIVCVSVPCLLIFLLVAIVFMFFFLKNRSRNKLIARAIENGYELPDSFYTGVAAKNITYQVITPSPQNQEGAPFVAANGGASAASPNATDVNQDNATAQAQESQVPPIPQNLPFSLSIEKRKYIRRTIYMIGIGISVFLFFICMRAAAPAFLLGGIPFLIGVGRLISLYLEKKGF